MLAGGTCAGEDNKGTGVIIIFIRRKWNKNIGIWYEQQCHERSPDGTDEHSATRYICKQSNLLSLMTLVRAMNRSSSVMYFQCSMMPIPLAATRVMVS